MVFLRDHRPASTSQVVDEGALAHELRDEYHAICLVHKANEGDEIGVGEGTAAEKEEV